MSLSQPSRPQDVVPLRPSSRSTGAAQDLENTIARFQAILTDDDRIKLQKLKAAQYDTQSIITFTAELDRLDSNRRGKSVASRLASLLQTIQQFTPVVDTYVSSHPNLAALIWGSMRLTFQLLANYTSYFESFVELLNGFGALGSRFSEYQLIFAQSKGLRDSIFKFHTVVILCCEKIVTIIRRPFKSQAWKALTNSFQSEIRDHVNDIKSKAEDVGQEIQLAKAQSDHREQQLQAEEREKAAANRSRLSTWFSKSSAEIRRLEAQEKRRTEEQRRHRLFKNLSSYNYNSAFNNTRSKRHLGTAEWILDTAKFKEWCGGDKSAVLHITGKIGSGKTVLASRVVEHLCQNRGPDRFVSFFFSRFDDITSLKCDAIIRSLIHQALCSVSMNAISPPLASEVMSCLEETKPELVPLEKLEKLYLKVSILFKDWFIILDGVDECDLGQQTQLYQFLSRCLQNAPELHNIKLLFSSRETTQTLIDQSFASIARLITGSNQTSSDIKIYTEDVLQSKLSSMQLMVGDPKIVDEIVDTIASKEEGMFLWVYLTIEDLCSRKSDKEIRQALQSIPTDLPATFNRVLGRIVQQNHQNTAMTVFKLVAGVHRPLTLLELREALSLEVGQSSLNSEDLINGIERVTVWCENLIHVEEGDSTVHFGHHSIREFLLGPRSGLFGEFHFELKDADRYVFAICITYLNLDNFKTGLVETAKHEQPASLQIPIGAIAGHTLQTAVKGSIGARIGQWATVKMKSTVAPLCQAPLPVGPLLATPTSFSISTEHYFWNYAVDNWYLHENSPTGKSESKIWNLLGEILRDPHPALSPPWMDFKVRENLKDQLTIGNSENPLKVGSLGAGSLRGRLQNSIRMNSDQFDLRTNLMFAVVFGIDKNSPLACRALMMLAEECPNTDALEDMVYFSAMTAGTSYPNKKYLRAVQQDVDHRRLVNIVTECVADGVKYWPASSHGLEGCSSQERGVGIHADICSLIMQGYNSVHYPSLRAFALVSLGRGGKLTLESICQAAGVDVTTIFQSMTALGKSIIDIAVESGSGEMLIETCFDHVLSHGVMVPPSSDKIWPQSLEQLRTLYNGVWVAIELGMPWTTSAFFRIASFDPSLKAFSDRMDLFVNAFRFYWPSYVASRMTSIFLPELGEVDHLPDLKRLFHSATESENWPFAGLLRMKLDEMAMLDWEHKYNQVHQETVPTQAWDFIKMTWECELCSRMEGNVDRVRELDKFPHGMKERPVLFRDVIFTFCSRHEKQVKTVLSHFHFYAVRESTEDEEQEKPSMRNKVAGFLEQGMTKAYRRSKRISMDRRD